MKELHEDVKPCPETLLQVRVQYKMALSCLAKFKIVARKISTNLGFSINLSRILRTKKVVSFFHFQFAKEIFMWQQIK